MTHSVVVVAMKLPPPVRAPHGQTAGGGNCRFPESFQYIVFCGRKAEYCGQVAAAATGLRIAETGPQSTCRIFAGPRSVRRYKLV